MMMMMMMMQSEEQIKGAWIYHVHGYIYYIEKHETKETNVRVCGLQRDMESNICLVPRCVIWKIYHLAKYKVMCVEISSHEGEIHELLNSKALLHYIYEIIYIMKHLCAAIHFHEIPIVCETMMETHKKHIPNVKTTYDTTSRSSKWWCKTNTTHWERYISLNATQQCKL